ncbi:MAG: hypothetical protein LQ348_005673 [Seirophora lacunosa]|nr:MAG: hypothetical protein LQ344_006621 [Seirophora lacunosa]KAI4178154.1 MAG: hypothetical protein LQ348_005673 [Seirophora lacunosa]
MADNADVLRRLQVEALGTFRRDHISTDDFNDANRLRPSIHDMERHRRVNQHGTNESTATDDLKNRINGWNSAWTLLRDDGILEEGLEDLNAGQSHRARLLSQSLPIYVPLPPNRSPQFNALDEARRFALEVRGKSHARGSGRGGRGGGIVGSQLRRYAQRRISTTGIPNVVEQLKPKPRVLLPSITGRPSSPEPKKISAERIKIQDATSALTATQKQARRSNVENFKLASPSHFMAHVHNSSKSAASKAIAVSDDPPVTAARSAPIRENKNLPKVTAQPVTKPMTATVLDTDPYYVDKDKFPAPRLSYTEDLLGIAIDKPKELPPPIEPSSREDDATQTVADQQDLRQQAGQLASFLPYLASVLPAQLYKELTSVYSNLQQKIDILDKDASAAQQALTSNVSRLVQALDKDRNVAPRSLANAVERRTREWSQHIITNTTTTKRPIFGEHVTRGRWAARRDSFTSVASSVGLVEGIEKLRLDEEAQPQAASQSTFSTEPQVLKPCVRSRNFHEVRLNQD